MQCHTWIQQRIVAIATLVTTLTILSLEAATAHGGHDHASEQGFDATVVLQVGGVAAALGIAYLLAAWVYRRRDRFNDDPGDPGSSRSAH